MRSILYTFAAFAIIGLAYWAYNENYATQEALRRVDKLQREIGQTQEKLSVLRAEWAYLNRPERLRELADLNFEELQLMPLSPEHFGAVEQVVFPVLKLEEIDGPLDVSADTEDMTATSDPADLIEMTETDTEKPEVGE